MRGERGALTVTSSGPKNTPTFSTIFPVPVEAARNSRHDLTDCLSRFVLAVGRKLIAPTRAWPPPP